jgi:hypothetical protein
MEWMDPLTANLLDLLFELREHPIPLTIGGGFGLYLKRMRLDQTRERTLFSQLPMPRATNDLDLFLRADVLCDLESMKAVAAALNRLGYEAVPEAMYMQWKKHFDLQGQEREIKVDLLVGPLGQFRDRLHVKGVRARPIGSIKLHAHTVEEAVHIDESPATLTISRNRSNGEFAEAQIRVPLPFTYLLMKLFAFRDRKEDEDKNLGRHHALDLYGNVAAAVWLRNTSSAGYFYDTTLTRVFRRKDGNWGDSTTFEDRDLPNLAKAAADVHTWIYQQKANAVTVNGSEAA